MLLMIKRRKKLSFIVKILLCLLICSISRSVKGAEESVPLKAGQTVPYDGILMPMDTAIELQLKLEYSDERFRAEISRATRIFEIELQAEKDRNKVEVETLNQKLSLSEAKVAEMGCWYKSPIFVATVSVISTLALFGLTGYVFGELSGAR